MSRTNHPTQPQPRPGVGVIRPGAPFSDDHGEVAQLHGVGLMQLDDTFWAWGEDKRSGSTFGGIASYTSHDLATWTFQGHSLAATGEVADLGPSRVVERPKVLRNPASGLFVMYLHIDSQDYSDARVGFAVSETPAGPYRYLGSERPLGNQSRDIGVFQDHDGNGYLLSEDRERGLHIYRLTDDYLQVSHLVCTTVTPEGVHGYESPALVRVADTYHLCGSDLTGWACNDNKVAMSRSLAGPWSAWRDIAPPGSATFESQISTVLTVTRPAGTALVYVGDRWLPDDLGNSPAVWLPLRFDDAGHASLEWRAEWSLADLPTLVTQHS